VKLAVLAAAVLSAAACGLTAGAEASPPKPYLWQCEQIHLETAKTQCYLRLLYIDVERSGDPARELPRIDRRVRRSNPSLLVRCHVLMHAVGRRYAREHHVTLATLQRYVPRSSDPGCSAGFGMGLVMYLGPEIIGTGGKSAVRTCLGLPTRYRSYTCIHGLGHAVMRGYHEALAQSVAACLRLGRVAGPDCAQGAFHDYWISLRAADETTRPRGAITSARVLCARYPSLALQCWYRFFAEQQFGPVIEKPADLRRVCRGLAGRQRVGCIAGASLSVLATGPFEQARICRGLAGPDADSCLRGVAVQAVEGKPAQERALIARCATFARAARSGCYSWFGLTLNVVTNGRFQRSGCPSLRPAPARTACRAGARRYRAPLLTFS
jgi:hypothetical protein